MRIPKLCLVRLPQWEACRRRTLSDQVPPSAGVQGACEVGAPFDAEEAAACGEVSCCEGEAAGCVLTRDQTYHHLDPSAAGDRVEVL